MVVLSVPEFLFFSGRDKTMSVVNKEPRQPARLILSCRWLATSKVPKGASASEVVCFPSAASLVLLNQWRSTGRCARGNVRWMMTPKLKLFCAMAVRVRKIRTSQVSSALWTMKYSSI
jgi:hypothetical protein